MAPRNGLQSKPSVAGSMGGIDGLRGLPPAIDLIRCFYSQRKLVGVKCRTSIVAAGFSMAQHVIINLRPLDNRKMVVCGGKPF